METRSDELEDFLAMQNLAFALFCRTCSAEPDEEFIGLLCGDAVGALLDVEEPRCSWARETALEIAVVRESPQEAVIDRLSTDFTALFLGPRKLPAPIWETVHIMGRNELFTEVTLSVRAQYKDHGFSIEGFPHMADDHLAAEFAFLSSLANAALSAHEQSDDEQLRAALDAQREFLKGHLNRWLKQCAEKMLSSYRKGGLYPSLMAFAAQFCHHSAKDLDALLA